MKELYTIIVELDEDSVYFADLTPREAAALRYVLRGVGYKYSVRKIRGGPGYNSFRQLMHMFKDMA